MSKDMMIQTNPTQRISLAVQFAIGLVVVLALSVWAFYALMHPPMKDLGLMTVFLTITTIVSGLASYFAYRLGWMYRSPTLRWTLLGVCGLSSLLTFINVWLTARLMFASPHDLLLATILLLYAGGIAIALGYFMMSAITDRIGLLKLAAEAITRGDLQTRLAVPGRDEIADLSKTFNQMSAQLQAAAEKQRQVEQMRRDLIAWVSHDLQTPLASIRAVIEALADGVVENPETVQRYLRTAQKDTAALSTLIDDLFQMAQFDAGGMNLDLGLNSIADLISDTLESFSQIAQHQGIDLHGQVSDGIDPVWIDAQRIGRVLNNLVNNALRHTPANGQVSVTASRRAENLLIEVCDTGEGIQAADIEHIFERFYRGDKSRNRTSGGVGLGLAISKAIVEAHGGSIQVESTPGKGTCFEIKLPQKASKI
jgi:signal transduction histidine kinase